METTEVELWLAQWEEELKVNMNHQWKELKKDLDNVLIKRNHLKKPGN